MTDVNGDRFYVHSIIFYVKFKYDEFKAFFSDIELNHSLTNNEKEKTNNHSEIISAPFAFSLISKYSSSKAFEPILKNLFFLYKTKLYNTDDFDNELIHIIYEIPAPSQNSSYVLFLPYFKTEIVSTLLKGKLINDYYYQLKDFLFGKLSIENIIEIFVLIILERKIIFISEKNSTLISITESFLSLIYPLKWTNTYIPILTEDSTAYIQSFIPFLMGTSYEIYQKFSDDKTLESEIFIVDIDKDKIISKNKNSPPFQVQEYFPAFKTVYDKLSQWKNMESIEIRYVFLLMMVDLIGTYQSYTSIVGDTNLFSQTCFISSKPKQYEEFYSELTSTQQFNQFIQFCSEKEYDEFNNLCSPNDEISEKPNPENFILYPYFFPVDKFTYDNFSESINSYYSSLTKTKKIDYSLSTEAFIRFSIIMQNFTPKTLKKYVFFSTYLMDNSNDISFSLDNTQNDILETSASVSNQIKHSSLPESNVLNLNEITLCNTNKNYNSNEEINTINKIRRASKIKAPRVPYRKQDSLIHLVVENEKSEEISQYKEQLYEIVHDYMSYIFINSQKIKLSLGDFSHFFIHNFIRKEFAFILYQEKFNNSLLHELTDTTFNDLSKVVFYCLVNFPNDHNQYESLRLITKSLFFYFKYTKVLSKQKYFLYEDIADHNIIFSFWKDQNFWKYFFTEDSIQNPLENQKEKLTFYMKKLKINENFINYCNKKIF